MTPDPPPHIARLLEALRAIDLASADGRAGLGVLLAEIERSAPDAILRQAASIDLRRLPIPLPPPCGEGPRPPWGRGGGGASARQPQATQPPAPDPHGPA